MIYIVFEEKHGPRYVAGYTLEKIMAYILNERIQDGYWYDEPDTVEAKLALASGMAPFFMISHKNFEYEGYTEIRFETV